MSSYGLLAELILLDVIAPTPTTTGAGSQVYPQAGHGFVAYILGGFFGLGVILLTMILLSLKPKRADPRLGLDHQREQNQTDEQ